MTAGVLKLRAPFLALLLLASVLRLVACLDPSASAATRTTLPVVELGPGLAAREPACLAGIPTPPPTLSEALQDTPLRERTDGALSAFYDALRQSSEEERVTRVVLFGDSHSAADHFPGRLREHLQSRFGYAGAGLVMPAQPMSWYRHKLVHVGRAAPFAVHSASRPDTRRDSRVGLSGFALHGTRGGTLLLGARAKRGESARLARVRAYFMRSEHGAELEIAAESGRSQLFTTQGKTGQLGIATLRVPDGHHEISLRGRGSGSLHLLGVALERDAGGVIVDTLGIVGARAREQLKIDDQLFHDQLVDRKPDLLVFAYGTNEAMDEHQPIARYRKELSQVVSRARRASPSAACLLVGPTDYPIRRRGHFKARRRTAEVIEAQAQVAEELGCATFDLVALTGGPLSMLQMMDHEPAFGARDRLHFTRAGYEAIADALAAELLRGYEARRLSLCDR